MPSPTRNLARVRLAAVLPPGEHNGLREVSGDDPELPRVAVVVFDIRSDTLDHDTGTHTLTLRVRRAEMVTRDDDLEVVRRAMLRANEQRTGRPVLPLDLEADLTAVFQDFVDDDRGGDEG
jgi:hypothetical protein